MSSTNEQPVDPRYVDLAKQCYHGTLRGSKLLTCTEFRAGKSQADLWLHNYWDSHTSDKSPSFESDMCQSALMLAEVVVFTREVALTPLDKVLNFARTKGLYVDGDGPTSQKVLADFQRFLLIDKERAKFARLGIDKVLEDFPLDVARGLALHLAIEMCPDEWDHLLAINAAREDKDDPGRVHADTSLKVRRCVPGATQAFIRYIDNNGGKRFLAENGIDALVEKYKASGGEIGVHYARKIIPKFFRAENEAGKAAKGRRVYRKGGAAALHTFMDTGGKEILATQGFDALLKHFTAAGGDIDRSYAKKVIRRAHIREYEAGETAKVAKAIEDSMRERD